MSENVAVRVYAQCSNLWNYLYSEYIRCRIPANKIHLTIVGSMLGQLRRRWSKIDTIMGKCLVFDIKLLSLTSSALMILLRGSSFNIKGGGGAGVLSRANKLF